ncbi:33 kDa ribonucleoprotein, chloroplastic-like [Chenopodium quinoa]|nr:33 kDa ribonucleoprotein, chloroplastic-like [Chenopodium quinoa]
MAAAASLSTIVTPVTSSSSLSFIPSENSFTYFSPKPKPFHKTLTLKSQNFTPSPLPLLFRLHLCHSSSAFNDTEDSITDGSEENSIGVEQEQEQELQQIQERDELEEIIDTENKGVDSVDDCRLFVGNLPYSMTSDQLSEVFAEAGQVRFIEIIYDKVTDRSRGFGFVTMGSVDEAKEAIRMFDGSQVGGRTVRVNFPEVPRGGERKVMGPKLQSSNVGYVDTPHKLYAGNLGWGITSQGLREAFANQEGFLSAKVIYERASGRSRGFGFITFSTADAAESALTTMNGVELEGRPLRLNMASDRARSNTEAYAEQSA